MEDGQGQYFMINNLYLTHIKLFHIRYKLIKQCLNLTHRNEKI